MENEARFSAGQVVIFSCPILGKRLEIRGKIEEVVHKLGAREVTYRIRVGEDVRLKHQNCIYGGIPDHNVLRRIE